MRNETNDKQCVVVNLQKLLTSWEEQWLSFFLIVLLVLCLQAYSCQLSLCVVLISGATSQAGSPETVRGIEDLYGELHSWQWVHGCLQRGSRWRSPALLRGGLILGAQNWGNQCDLGPEINRLWTSQSRPIKQDFHSKDKKILREERGLCLVWRRLNSKLKH